MATLTEDQVMQLVQTGQMRPDTASQYMQANYGSAPSQLRTQAEASTQGSSAPPASPRPPELDPNNGSIAGLEQQGLLQPGAVAAPVTQKPAIPDYDPSVDGRIQKVLPPGTRPGEQAPPGSLATDKAPPPPNAAPTLPSNNPAQGGGGSLPPSKAGKEMRDQIQFEMATVQSQANDEQAILARKTEAELARNKALADQKELDLNDQKQRFQKDEERRTTAFDAAQREMDDAVSRGREAAKREVDPKRFWGNLGTGGQIIASIGMALGEFGSALTHQPNGAAQLIENAIARDIDAQKENIANGMAGARMGMEGAKAKYGMAQDDASFSAKARVEQLGFAQAKLDVMASRLSDPVAKANAQQLGSLLQQQQAKATADLARQKIALDAADEAKAAAAASAGAVSKATLIKEYHKLVQENMGRGDDLRTAQARAMSTLNMGNFGNIDAYPRKKGEKMTDQEEASLASDQFNKQVDDIVKDPALKELGLVAGVGGAVSGVPYVGPRVASDSAALKTTIDTFNTQLLQAVGKVAKDADGKPNKDMIEKIEKRFSIDMTDTPDQARVKVEGARRVVNALARQQGALNAPVPGEKKDQAAKDAAGFEGEK